MNAALEALERHAVDRPNHAAIVGSDGEVTTYAQILDRALRIERAIKAEGSNEVLAVSLPSGADFWCAVIAAARSGAMPALVPCPVPGILEGRIARELGSPLRIDAALLARLPSLGRLDASNRTTSGNVDRRRSAGVILLSSGTTGHSRFIERGADALDRLARGLVEEDLIRPSDVVCSCLPMSHAYGFEHSFLGPLLAGATVRVLDRFTVEHVAAALEEGATTALLIPCTARLLAEARPLARRLRLAVSAGSPLTPVVRAEFDAAFGTPLVDLYGASELGTIWLDRGQGGQPVRGVEVAVIAPAVDAPEIYPAVPGASISGAREGEIAVRSSHMLRAIVRPDGSRRELGASDWFRTGDLGVRSEEGTLRITGRRKLVFDVGGLKVNPIEVEQALESHPAVARALVQPVAVHDTLHRVAATIEPRRRDGRRCDVGPDDLRRHLSALLPAHAIPRNFTMVDQLPQTESGKPLRASTSSSAPEAISPVVKRPAGLDERTARESYTAQLFNETARGYDNSSGAAFLRSGRWYRRRMLIKSGLRAGACHLDVGSGTGLCAAIGQEIVGPTGRVVALDPSTGMLDVARRRGVRETVVGRAESLPFPDASFDMVSMSYMLRHIEDLLVAFREVRRVLRPGGRIVIFEVTRPEALISRSAFDLAMYWIVPGIGVVASGRPSTFPMMQYWADTMKYAARPDRIVEALDHAGLVGTRHLLELGVFSCYRGSAPHA